MAKLYNRAWVNTATAGTGTMTLGAARTGYFTFAEAGVQNSEVVSYTIEDGDDFEIGIGTYTSAGTTLSRDTVTASKIVGVAGTSKINLSGNANVFITVRKEDILSITETQSANGVFAGPASGAAAAPAFRAIVADDFGTKVANTLLAGPTTGADAKPSFRTMVLADIPDSLITVAKLATAARPVWNLILSQEASASATIDFTTANAAAAFDGTYKRLAIVISNLKVSADDTEVVLQFGTGAGPTYQTTNYTWEMRAFASSGVHFNDFATNDNGINLTSDNGSTALGNAAGENLCATIYIDSPELSNYKMASFESRYVDAISRLISSSGGGIWLGGTTAVTAFRITPDAGDLASGTITLYGIDHAL